MNSRDRHLRRSESDLLGLPTTFTLKLGGGWNLRVATGLSCHDEPPPVSVANALPRRGCGKCEGGGGGRGGQKHKESEVDFASRITRPMSWPAAKAGA
jgi:hypothetical protein